MKQYEVIRKAGHKLTSTEQELKQKIDLIAAKMSQGTGLDQTSLRTLQYQIQALQESGRLDALRPVKEVELENVKAMENLQTILTEQQGGIKIVSEMVIKDLKDLDIMKYGFQLQCQHYNYYKQVLSPEIRIAERDGSQ